MNAVQHGIGKSVALALDRLKQDVLAFGDGGSPGAIMEALLKIPKDYWHSNAEYWFKVKKLLERNVDKHFFERKDFDDTGKVFRT